MTGCKCLGTNGLALELKDVPDPNDNGGACPTGRHARGGWTGGLAGGLNGPLMASGGGGGMDESAVDPGIGARGGT